jgi:nucleotide-binding universal stress UspA family protein
MMAMTDQPTSDELPGPVEDRPPESPTTEDETSVVGATVKKSIRRILVALDASANSRAALEEAVGLAEALHSEIVGLFVEDINLVRLAELPFVREVRFAETDVRQLEREGLQRKLRARAAVLKHELEEMTGERKVPSTFRVIRGPVDRELLTAALEADLLALGRLGHSVVQRTRLGSTAQTVIARATSAVLLVKTGVEAGPVIALYDGSMGARRAIYLAAEIAGQVGDLRVLVWARDEQTAFEHRQLAVELLKDSAVHVQFQHLSGDDPQMVIKWINRQKGSLLVFSNVESQLPADIVQTLLDEAEQHLLVIR